MVFLAKNFKNDILVKKKFKKMIFYHFFSFFAKAPESLYLYWCAVLHGSKEGKLISNYAFKIPITSYLTLKIEEIYHSNTIMNFILSSSTTLSLYLYFQSSLFYIFYCHTFKYNGK